LRFTNAEVLTNLAGVVDLVRNAPTLRSQTSPQDTPPSLSPPHKGGGNTQTSACYVAPRKRGGEQEAGGEYV
jgi:hypothetical protein